MFKGREKGRSEKKRLSLFSCVTIVITCMHIIVIAFALLVIRAYSEMDRLTNTYLDCTEKANSFVEASDYLTNRTQMYVMTGNTEYMDDYIEELTETKRREKAVSALTDAVKDYRLLKDSEIDLKAETVMNDSKNLEERELYAMRLESAAQGISDDDLSDTVRSVTLSDADKALSPDAMHKAAEKMIFNSEYYDVKEKLTSTASQSADSILENIDYARSTSHNSVKRNIVIYVYVVLLIVIADLIVFLTVNLKIIRPLRKFRRALETDEQFEVTGSNEMREFAVAYNSLYLHNRRRTSELEKNNEIDPLTGLFNRRAFESLRETFRTSEAKLVFVVMDVDNFKSINDTCGHPIGDEALRSVSDELKRHFHSSDFIFRLGGDEFAVLLTNTGNVTPRTVTDIVGAINSSLREISIFDGRLSISAGAAVSHNGFNDALYANADAALYTSKTSGRARCTVDTQQPRRLYNAMG